MIEQRVEYSPTGKPVDRELWTNVEQETKADVRRMAACFLVGLEQDYRKPAVWVDGVRLSPSAEDVEHQRQRLAAYRESGDIQAA